MLSQPSLAPSLNGLSTYSLDKLLSLWKSGSISLEQLAGYLLQNVVLLEKRVHVLEKSLLSGSVQAMQVDREHVVG